MLPTQSHDGPIATLLDVLAGNCDLAHTASAIIVGPASTVILASARRPWFGVKGRFLGRQIIDHLFGPIDRHLITYRADDQPIASDSPVNLSTLLTHGKPHNPSLHTERDPLCRPLTASDIPAVAGNRMLLHFSQLF
jgi:hypothetical protein